MSRQGLKNFIRAAERNLTLRKEIIKCSTFDEVISIANPLGFKINAKDFLQDKHFSEMEDWFQKSEIPILRK